IVFDASSVGPLAKDFDTRSQLRRAALSSMNNIAEGFGRYHDRDKVKFYNIAQSSAMEVLSMTYVLSDLKYLPDDRIESIADKANDARNLTLGLIRHINGRNKGGPK